ncbi:MAG: DNA translocase FtsK [Clostridia bacterium]|nr:DNA translocase FtsK [Clostridia bacterium]
MQEFYPKAKKGRISESKIEKKINPDKDKLPVLSTFLGYDSNEGVVLCDMANIAHLLITGKPGSGHLSFINTMICDLLIRYTPAELKLLILGIKNKEMSVYNGLPYMLLPNAARDADSALKVLRMALSEMDDRYTLFDNDGTANIVEYNAKMKEGDKFARIIIVVDEAEELVRTGKREIEEIICSLARLGRRAGIYTIIASENPSWVARSSMFKDYISKACFAVTTASESNSIMGQAGAEELKASEFLFRSIFMDSAVKLSAVNIEEDKIYSIVELNKSNNY